MIFTHNREKIHRIKDGYIKDRQGNDLRYYNQAHARAHLLKSEDPDKIRMVFGVPKLLLMAEAMLLWPIIRHLAEKDGPMLWGFETLKGGWYATHRWFSTKRPSISTFLALDWKSFDKKAQFTVIDDIHDVLKSYLTFDEGYHPTIYYPNSTSKAERTNNLWKWMTNAIKHTPDVLPNGDTYVRQHAGIASGFLQTQLLDSMYNALMLLTILSKLDFNIDRLHIKVQGDDSILGLLEYIHPLHQQNLLDMIAFEADRYFGATMNTKKSKISSSLEGLPLLGFTNRMGIPFKERDELIANLLYPERKSD